MSDLYAEPTASPRPSNPVTVAVGLTWVVSTTTAAAAAVMMVMMVLFLGPVFDAFHSGTGNPPWIAYGSAQVSSCSVPSRMSSRGGSTAGTAGRGGR